MEQHIFYSLLSLVGPEFLSYILNYETEISYRSKWDYLDLTESQIDVIRDLLDRIDEWDTEIGSDPEASLPFYLFDSKDSKGISLFNQYRKRCGAKEITIRENDQLMEFILNKAVHYYPSLLLKEDFSTTRALGDKSTFFDDEEEKLEHLMELVKKDEELAKLITVDKDENWRIGYTFKNNFKVTVEGYRFIPYLLTRAFYNCCYRNAYAMEDFLQEVRENVKKLRAIGNGQEINWSIFCGLNGLAIEDEKGFYLSDECFLKGIGKSHTILKSLYSTVANAHIGVDPEGIVAGSIAEIKFPGNKSVLTNPLTAARDIIPQIVQHLDLALAFSKRQNYTPVAKTFFDIDLPIIGINPYWEEKKCSSTTVVESRDIVVLKDWFHLLQNSNAHLLRIPMQRLKNAILERDGVENAILDGQMAWEGLFSKRSDASNAISQSIDSCYSKALGSRLPEGRTRKLYELRTYIVQGKPGEDAILQNTTLPELRDEIVDIGLECVKGVLKDKNLSELAPEERVREILEKD